MVQLIKCTVCPWERGGPQQINTLPGWHRARTDPHHTVCGRCSPHCDGSRVEAALPTENHFHVNRMELFIAFPWELGIVCSTPHAACRGQFTPQAAATRLRRAAMPLQKSKQGPALAHFETAALLEPCGATGRSTKGKAVFYHKAWFLFECCREGMGHSPQHGLGCCGWKGVSVQREFIDLYEKSWRRPSRLLPPKVRPFGAVWVDAVSTSARGKPDCSHTEGSSFLQQWKHEFCFKRKVRGCFGLQEVFLFLDNRRKTKSSVTQRWEMDGLEVEEVALVSGGWQPAVPSSTASSSEVWWYLHLPSASQHTKKCQCCHRQLCPLCSWFICLQPFLFLPLTLCPELRDPAAGNCPGHW